MTLRERLLKANPEFKLIEGMDHAIVGYDDAFIYYNKDMLKSSKVQHCSQKFITTVKERKSELRQRFEGPKIL